MQSLMEFYNQILTLSNSNQLLATGVALWGLGILTWLGRTIPLRVWTFVTRLMIARMVITNATGRWEQDFQYAEFLRWYSDSPWFKMSKSISLTMGSLWKKNKDGSYDGDVSESTASYGPGPGLHVFIKGWRLYWFDLVRLDSSGSEKLKEQVTIFTFSFGNNPLIELANNFMIRFSNEKQHIMEYGANGWVRSCELSKRSIHTVFIDKHKLGLIQNKIDFVLKYPEWFYERGLACKSTIVLEGKPGGGKTTLIRALASHYKKNVCIIGLSSHNDRSLMNAFATIPKDSFVLIEDFDSESSTHSREDGVDNKSVRMEDKAFSMLSLSGILNALDGIVTLNNTILFMTTNYPDRIDSALMRNGRVDLRVSIMEMDDPLVRNYIRTMFPDAILPKGVTFNPIMGCDLQSLYFDHSDDPEEFMRVIPHTFQQTYPSKVVDIKPTEEKMVHLQH